MNLSGATQVFGLVGHPVRHSLSPSMHTALFRRFGIDAVYVPFDVDPRRAGAVASAIRTLDLRGVNLTVPFKSEVVADLDHLTQAAREARAVNVVIHHEGTLTGYNTDGEGWCRAWDEEVGVVLDGAKVVLLGAGGAAAAIAASVADRGAREVVFLNRSVGRAEATASHLASFFPRTRFAAAALDPDRFRAVAPSAAAIVNCTAGGAEAVIDAFAVDGLAEGAVWSDINYWMASPPAVAACRARDIAVQLGMGMLLHQGALSFELFTGIPVDVAEMRADLDPGGGASPS